jgi:hypothetical protein
MGFSGLDGDASGVFDKDRDFAFFAGLGDSMKFYYSPRVTREAAERHVFGNDWPKHIATLAEVEARASQEDPVRHVPSIVKDFPKLSILVFESRQHHVKGPADHPQAIMQVNAWIEAGAHWVRFNPDIHYVEAAMGSKLSRPVQFPAGTRLDRRTIRDYLESENTEGGPTDKQGMSAAVCELADRTYRNNWAPVLEKGLVTYK